MSTRLRLAAGGAIAVRLVAAAVLLFGPWTDDPSELQGWDVERFQEIADTAGTPYIDHEVEYPPLTVIVAEIVLADDVVSSHQRLVVVSLLIDLAVAAVLARAFGPTAGAAYLVIGLPLVPSGLLRLDLWAGLAAVTAAAAVAGQQSSRHQGSEERRTERRRRMMDRSTFAVMVTIGTMIKLWPALLIPAAVGIKRSKDAAAAVAMGTVAGVVWLTISGTAALEQITSLRGVTGWHLESIPGSLIALFGTESPRLEADAFRIGELDNTMVLIGRIAVLGLVAAATVLAQRSNRQPAERLALVMLVSVAGLIITAPLLSPQFLLWLTPWTAIVHRDRALVLLTFGAVGLTAVVLAAFGPPDLDHPVAAVGLLTRDGFVLALIGTGMKRLVTSDWFEYS